MRVEPICTQEKAIRHQIVAYLRSAVDLYRDTKLSVAVHMRFKHTGTHAHGSKDMTAFWSDLRVAALFHHCSTYKCMPPWFDCAQAHAEKTLNAPAAMKVSQPRVTREQLQGLNLRSARSCQSVAILVFTNQSPISTALRSYIRTILLDKWKTATGEPHKQFSWKKLAERVMAVRGLPQDVQQTPISKMTRGDLMKIFDARDHFDIIPVPVTTLPVFDQLSTQLDAHYASMTSKAASAQDDLTRKQHQHLQELLQNLSAQLQVAKGEFVSKFPGVLAPVNPNRTPWTLHILSTTSSIMSQIRAGSHSAVSLFFF
jgi:hypothetical protein